MNKSKNYWIERQKVSIRSVDKKAKSYLTKLEKDYRKVLRDLEKDIADYYVRYGKDDILAYEQMLVKLSASDLELLYRDYDALIEKYPDIEKYQGIRNSYYKLSRMEGLQLDASNKLNDLYGKYNSDLEKLLKIAGNTGYKTITGHSMNSKALEYMLRNRWIGGKNFSDSIWTNKNKLQEVLNKTLKDAMKTGKGSEKVAREVRKALDSSFNDAKRLVRTEIANLQEQGNLSGYKDAGIEKYEYLSILDDRTSEQCNGLNGQVFYVKDAQTGINYPPGHPYCRSTTIPYFDKNKK